MIDLTERYRVETVVIDMHQAEDVAHWIEDELGIPVIDHEHRLATTHVNDYAAFMDGLRNATLKHTGDLGLRTHVLHAIAHRLPGGDLPLPASIREPLDPPPGPPRDRRALRRRDGGRALDPQTAARALRV